LIIIENTLAAECKPTVSWKIDPQFFVGETGKLVATVSNGCDKTFDVKTEVNAERTEGYIKVYKVQSEDETPRPKSHLTEGGLSYSYNSLEKGEKANIVYFIQPDEQAKAPGTYVLFEKFYVEGELQESKEIKITVSKSIMVTYQIPTQLQLNKPFSSTLTINNMGTEIVTSLKICLSSVDGVVSFLESCKSWVNLPSRFTDKFTTYINGLVPGNFQNEIKVTINYHTFTGLDVSETYYHPTLKISAVQNEIPSYSYRVSVADDSLTFRIKNEGNGIGYDCSINLVSPTNCFINSSDISNFTKAAILPESKENTYLIMCSDLILPNDESAVTVNFNPNQITPPCPVSGSITYKDSFGKLYETKILKFNLIETVTTIPFTPEKDRNYIWYILLIVVIAVVAFVLIAVKVPKVRNFLSQKFPGLAEKLSKIVSKLKTIFKFNRKEVEIQKE